MPLKLIKKLFKKSGPRAPNHSPKAKVMARGSHIIQDKDISPNVLTVLKKLNDAGFDAYLVGGGVRDLLLHKTPKDFDVATHARPEQIKKIFRNCRLIGRRFRLAHVFFHDEIIEVSTFRGEDTDESQHHQRSEHGMIKRDNAFGSDIEADALRRDFTINALYYTIVDHSILDFTTGIQDIDNKVLRIIGDPVERYREDPVRILRAIRLAAKLNFTIDKATEAPFAEMGHLLANVATSRLFEETIKLFHNGNASLAFQWLEKYNLLRYLLPGLQALLKKSAARVRPFLTTLLSNTDSRIEKGQTISPTFLLAALLWPLVEAQRFAFRNKKASPYDILEEACQVVISKEVKALAIPRRIVGGMREIYALQLELETRNPDMIHEIINNKRFRAAYDLLLLRQDMEKKLTLTCDWWKQFQDENKNKRNEMIKQLPLGTS